MYIYGNSAFMAELFFAKKLEKLCQTFCEATVRFKKTTKEDAKIILELIKELATYEKCERFEWYA